MRVGENLLHFLNSDNSLRIGNAGWSYTLNRKGAFAVTPVSTQVIEPASARGSTNFWREAAREGPQIHGYFEGRSPCQEIAKLLKVPKGDACTKIKWQLILYQDPVTHAPTSYALGGLAWRNPPKTGKCAVSKGTKEDPAAVVLDPDDAEGFLSFQKADENILLFLGNDRELLVGNEDFSYTLNRFHASVTHQYISPPIGKKFCAPGFLSCESRKGKRGKSIVVFSVYPRSAQYYAPQKSITCLEIGHFSPCLAPQTPVK